MIFAIWKLHYSYSDMNLSKVRGVLIPAIVHPYISWGWLQKETVEDLCQGNKADTIPWEQHCHFMNNCVMNCSHQNIFPCSTDETGEKKWAPQTFISRTSCSFVKTSRNNSSMNNNPPRPSATRTHTHIHINIQK